MKEPRSNINSKEEREVYRIDNEQSLVERHGRYSIKTVKPWRPITYRGVDLTFDLPEILEIVERGE